MKRLLVAAFAALALLGCQKAPEEKAATPEAQPQATRAAPARSAPLLDARPITPIEIDACKDAKVESLATEQRVSVATIEWRARRMQTLPAWTYNGMTVAFTKTIWHSCEEAIKASRRAQAVTPVQNTDRVNLTRQQYNQLRADAYENPDETDPAKLRSFREKAGRLEVQQDTSSKDAFTLGLAFLTGILVGIVFFKMTFRRKTASPQKKDLPREDPRPAAPETPASPPATPDDFTGR